ncbi:putative ethanolamine kinase [Bienertia sinuspersici]
MGAPSSSDAMAVAGEAQFNGSLEVLSSSLSVDTSLSLSDMIPPVIELCKDIFEKWSRLDDSCFSVEKVSGGITNLLLKVTVKEEDGNEVSITVRLYGPNTDYVVNRERELQAIGYLSAAGFGAKLLALFGNGMVQSFIKARTLTPPGNYHISSSADSLSSSLYLLPLHGFWMGHGTTLCSSIIMVACAPTS